MGDANGFVRPLIRQLCQAFHDRVIAVEGSHGAKHTFEFGKEPRAGKEF